MVLVDHAAEHLPAQHRSVQRHDDWLVIIGWPLLPGLMRPVPVLVTPRHVQRLLGSLSMTIRLIGDEIAVADLIGIEAVRVLHPALFEALASVAGYLSATTGIADQGGYQHGRNPSESPIAPVHAAAPGLAEDVCRWLFPAARRYFENTHYGSEWEIRWRQQRKIASSAVFRFYLERQLPDDVVPARAVEHALSRLADHDELRQFLAPWSPSELLNLLERMTPAIEELPVNDDAMDEDPARIALPVLLDLLPRLPEDLGAFLPHGSMFLMKIALRLLQRIPGESTRTAIIRGVLHDTRILSGRLILLRVARHREDIGAGLIDAAAATELEDELRNTLITQPPDDFAAQDRIARLADLMAETEDGKAALRGQAEDNRVMLSLLLECSGKTRGREIGAVAVEVTKVLQWDRLAEWLGEDMLVRRIAEVFSAVADDGMEISEEEHAVLDLAADYATGNRPQTPWERLARRHHVADTAEAVAADDEHQGGD